MLELVLNIAQQIVNMKWWFVRAPEGAAFITSDPLPTTPSCSFSDTIIYTIYGNRFGWAQAGSVERITDEKPVSIG